MRLGVLAGFGPTTPPDLMVAAARGAEARGVHAFWVPEHVVFFREYASRYPYAEDGKIPGHPDGVLEPFTVLTFLAAHTERIRLGTGICLVPQRNPVYTAKQVADLDYLSGGRVDFGVGIGWLREEFAALGVPWPQRAARTREYLEVMKTLWCDEVSRYQGELYTLPECVQNPKPVQKPHPPIYFGGESDPALRRVVEQGQGWFGFNLSPPELASRLKRLEELLAEAGRARDDVAVLISPYLRPLDPDTIAAYRELGTDQLVVPLVARDRDGLERALDRIAGQG